MRVDDGWRKVTVQQERQVGRSGLTQKRPGEKQRHTDVDTLADGDAVALCAAGDDAAIERLYARHGGACLALARQILVDSHLAEDAVQEAFLQLWRNAAAFDRTRSSPRTYLVMLTRARAIDRVRREQRHAALHLVEDHDRADERPGPEAQAVTAGLGREAVAALTVLSEVQREALVLAYWGGYSQQEIAVLTATPLGTVKTRMRAGLRALSEAMGPIGASAPSDRQSPANA